MIYLKPEILSKLRASISDDITSQKTLLETNSINLLEDNAEIDIDNCFVATEEEISGWIDEQKGSDGLADAERAELRASFLESYPELYPDVGAKYLVTSELSDGQKSVFAVSLQVNQGQLGMRLMQFYGLYLSHDEALAAARALDGLVFI